MWSLVSFILSLTHPVDASWLLACKCKIQFNMRKTVQKCHQICYRKRQCFSFWGTSSRRPPHTRAPPLDPAGGLPSTTVLACAVLKISLTHPWCVMYLNPIFSFIKIYTKFALTCQIVGATHYSWFVHGCIGPYWLWQCCSRKLGASELSRRWRDDDDDAGYSDYVGKRM